MKHKLILFVFFEIIFFDLIGQDFLIPISYSVEKKSMNENQLIYVGSKNDDLVFYCRETQKFFLMKDNNYRSFNLEVPKFNNYDYVMLEGIYDNKVIWKALSNSVNSQKIICYDGNKLLFEHTFPYSYEYKVFYSRFYDGGKSICLKSFFNPWHEYGDVDSNLITVKFGESEKITKIDSSLNVIPFSNKIYYSKLKKYFFDDERNEYSTMDIHCRNEKGLDRIIAKDADLLMLSDDGLYMLAKKKLYGKEIHVIIDLTKNKCIYLLSEKYVSRYFYYDVAKKSFSYDCGNKIETFSVENEFIYDPLEEFSLYKSDCERFWKSH